MEIAGAHWENLAHFLSSSSLVTSSLNHGFDRSGYHSSIIWLRDFKTKI